IAAALATRWLYLRCFSCSTGSIVSITPPPPKFSHLAKPLYASTLFVVAVICSRSLALLKYSSRNTVRTTRPSSRNAWYGWSHLQLAYLTVGGDEARRL